MVTHGMTKDWDDEGWCHIVGDIWGVTFGATHFGLGGADTLELQKSLLITTGNNEISPTVISYSRRLVLKTEPAVVPENPRDSEGRAGTHNHRR